LFYWQPFHTPFK